jgi:hypothetical protein
MTIENKHFLHKELQLQYPFSHLLVTTGDQQNVRVADRQVLGFAGCE